ncbi:MAG: methyltransferase domain-containing protein [candidate division WOR-3 bacterium]|nr:MAG: methyltransferase domain-containing protein [candidate division WOR-3 bacterium]
MKDVRWAVFTSGAAAVIAQTVLIREGLSLFGGYELISGILLSMWLVWAGIGSFFFSRLRFRGRTTTVYAVLLAVLSMCLVYSLVISRYALRIFGLPFGEVIPLHIVVVITMIMLAPTCFVFGMLYPSASRIISPEKVYLLEGIGAFLGGIAVSFFFVQIMPPCGIILSMIIVLLVCLGLLTSKKLLTIPLVLCLLFFQIPSIEWFLREQQLGRQELVGLKESKYGVIAVTKMHGQLNIFTNGVFDFSYPDQYSTEQAVHYPLLLHRQPRSVLLIGGGVGHCIEQIQKHPSIENITYVELDPSLLTVGEQFIGRTANGKAQVHYVFGDARYLVKTTDESFDVIILNIPDPVNAQLNRFYTREFFGEVRKVLRSDGLFSLGISAPADIIGPLFGQFLNSIDRSLRASFTSILHLPAARTTFIAGEHVENIDSIPDVLSRRIRERNLDLEYVSEYYFAFDFTAEKLRYIEQQVAHSDGIMNTDARPVCYYFTMMLWGGIVTDGMRNLFSRLFTAHPLLFLLPLVGILLFFKRRSMVYLSVFTIGASEISAEIILIVLFQIFYGYLYGWIGAIIACYMLGLACGTFFYMRSSLIRGKYIRLLSYVEIAMALYCALIAAVLVFTIPGAHIVILILIFSGGFLGGLHFPLSVKIMRRRNAGIVYGIDLVGSSIGALITAILFIPILGLVYTLMLLIIVNLLVSWGLRTI